MTHTEELLTALVESAGDEEAAAVVGLWIARNHRERARLMWARPEAPARAPSYLAWVGEQDCALCRAPAPSEAHHYGPRGVGQKTDDYRCVPVCRRCHERAHAHPRELAETIRRAMVTTLVTYLRIVEQT